MNRYLELVRLRVIDLSKERTNAVTSRLTVHSLIFHLFYCGCFVTVCFLFKYLAVIESFLVQTLDEQNGNEEKFNEIKNMRSWVRRIQTTGSGILDR